MRIIAKLLLLSLEEDEEVVLNAVMSALGSFENKTQLKEEIACEKLAFEGMEIDASKRLVYRGEKEVNITFTEFEILYLLHIVKMVRLAYCNTILGNCKKIIQCLKRKLILHI